MATFDDAIATLLGDEGGYINSLNDPGGETKYGISKRAYPNLDIKNLTVAQAEQIYERDFWNPLYNAINSQAIATKLLDLAANQDAPGFNHPAQAVKTLQRALGLEPDGYFGPATLAAVNAANPDKLLPEWRAQCARFYALVLARNPKMVYALLSWMRRAVR
ncbi:MAG: peptidoglycan-binding protein [Patescibacteria group bacterium]|nr:peptidoglycan-binding protein [Patescibacteria group bacterium]